jgi:hypothetical protein
MTFEDVRAVIRQELEVEDGTKAVPSGQETSAVHAGIGPAGCRVSGAISLVGAANGDLGRSGNTLRVTSTIYFSVENRTVYLI